METLNIDDGAVRLCINGDEDRVITFYPTDAHFAEAFFGLAKTLNDKQKELEKLENVDVDEGLKVRLDTGRFVREEIDKVFGRGTSQTAFGDHDNLSCYIQFFRGIEPYVRNARKKEIERYMKDGSDDGVMDA